MNSAIDNAVLEFLKNNPMVKAKKISEDQKVVRALRKKFSFVESGEFNLSYVAKETRLSLARLRRAGKISSSSNSLWVCKTDISKYLNMRFDISVGAKV